uniref:Secretory carrier-associated membrane protein n=1 Tax=Macrostomum lignano TaxID=282301 RepID=A0A1I8ICA4_9PLAT
RSNATPAQNLRGIVSGTNALSLGKSNSVFAKVELGVVFADKYVAKNPQRAGRNVQAHESGQADGLTHLGHLRSLPVRVKLAPPKLKVMGGRLGILAQSTMYSPAMMGVAPISFCSFVTSALGPAIKEVPVRVPVQVEGEHGLRYEFLFDHPVEHGINSVHSDGVIAHAKDAIEFGGDKSDARLFDGFAKGNVGGAGVEYHVEWLLRGADSDGAVVLRVHDPSVQQAARGSQAAAVQDFNPFEKGQERSAVAGPAVLPATGGGPQQAAPPPPYTSSAQQPAPSKINTDELEKRQRELDAKARELERREEEQRQREQDLSAGGFRANNWPPLPSFSPIGPCFYQDIDLEIPLEFRRIVQLAYYLWMAHASVLLINIIGAITYFIAVKENKANAGTVFGVSLIVFNFFLFFLMLFVQFSILTIQCLGLDYLGSCGWINAFVMMKESTAVGVLMLIIAIAFTALAALDLLLLVQVHRIYRSTGASFAKARQEFSQGVLTNEAVRGAAADAATATARSAFTGGGSGSGGRY